MEMFSKRGSPSRRSWDMATRSESTSPRSSSESIRSTRSKIRPHVAVIGAGFAGLRCADVLLRSGARVTLLEARDRVGGRVYQCLNDGHLLDVGANWIHGAPGNPIGNLAAKTKTITTDPPEGNLMYDTNGHKMPERFVDELVAEVWETIATGFQYSNEHHAKIDPQLSLYDYFGEQMRKKYPDNPQRARDVLQAAHYWGFYVGDSIETQSLRCLSLEECIDGENKFVASSYKSILDEVKSTAMRDAEIKFNTEVVKIEYREREGTDDGVLLTSKNGEKSTFDEVVVTCPLGWLKRNKTAFHPSLPSALSTAIDNINYGHLEKLYVSFPSAFWMGSPASGSSDSPTPMVTLFQHPSYHPDPASKKSNKWNQNFYSLAHLPGRTASPTMLCYLYGECGTHLTRTIKNYEPGSESYSKLLAAFFEPFLTRLPNYSATDSNCKPSAYYISQWQNDPHAGYGSYSNFQVGLEEGEQDIETMRYGGGLSEAGRGIWFAGEHTGPFLAMGTTNGAYWSGEFVAKSIGEMYGLDVKTGVDDPIDIIRDVKISESKVGLFGCTSGG